MTVLFANNSADEIKEQFINEFPTTEFIFNEDMYSVGESLAEVSVLVGYGSTIKADLLEKMPKLKWIMMLSAGVDQLPLEYITEKGIIVTNARGVYKVPMAEYVISVLLQVYKQEKKLIEYENGKVWADPPAIREISGRTMVVVGAGAIGQEVARLAKAFNMTTYGVSRSGRALEYFDEMAEIGQIDEYLPKADFVVSVLPGTKETTGIFQYEQFKLMKEEAVFVNIGRGNSVNSEALLKAIQEKEITHAVLDVFEQEPLPSDHPFWTEENITITPHLSAKSPRNAARTYAILTENLKKFIEGDTDFINIVDTKKGY
ncbi:NAD(P)-dependent oxidoreductase [Ornithinibacillus sp. 4-3]|uniref:NAD(P)-dependent oxidoreductase n=1 Tax=Ornithinibacillus sp. 4-3 TaxID=3231488 RepID=A0AB39HNK1_9BACI